ncbi:DUF4365 domain-containing protein [Nocardia takedensis]
MPTQGSDDHFEQSYMAALKVLLTFGGIPVDYAQDRAAIDIGLHLFVQGHDQRTASQTRLWFQAKGKRTTTLSAEDFDSTTSVDVSVQIDHLRYWFDHPEPVYLVVYIESKNVFLAEDVRTLVDRRWPRSDFYQSTRGQTTATLRLDSTAVLDRPRIEAMLVHRSMRIDGTAFQGRPMGHRLDPLRSILAIDTTEHWTQILDRIMQEFRFDPSSHRSISAELSVRRGVFRDTMLWQSPAFAEYGYDFDDDVRIDPHVESVHGPAIVITDSMPNRRHLTAPERAAVTAEISRAEPDLPVILFFYGHDLSATGGTWRRFLREETLLDHQGGQRMLGIEAISYLVLATTMVYLDLAPHLSFQTPNRRY